MPLSLQFGESSTLQRRGRESDAVLATALRRLASGLRIEQGSDDPGRLSSTVQLQARIRGSSVGLRNFDAGTSLLETVDGGLAEAEQILQRLRELSLVAVSEQRTSFERRALQGEADQLIKQLSQISESRGYQGMQLFDGTPTRFQLQSGRGGDGTEDLLLRFADLRPTSLGRQARYDGERRGVFLSPLLSGELTINGVSIRGSVAIDDQISTKYNDGSALAKAAAINSATRFTGVRAIVGPTEVTGLEALRAIDLSEDHFLLINGQKISGFEVHARDAGGHLITEINRASEASGVVASVDDEGRIILSAEDGRNIQVVYSDISVREAMRFIDAFGDKLNLSNTIELDSPDRTLHGKVEPGVNQILEVDSTYSGAVSASGEYQLPRDHVDYVIQIVEAGPVGVAKYRFKEELVSDPDASEDFAFLAGTVDPAVDDTTAGGSRYLSLGGSITGGGSYNEGIDRTFTLEVTKAGTTDGTLAERAEYSVRSDVDGALAAGLLATESVAQQIDDEGVTVTFGQTTRSQTFTGSNLAAGHDYDRTPSLRGSYTGDVDKSFIIEVSQGGYTDGSAELQVSEDGGTTFGPGVAIQGNTNTAIGDGLSLRFPDRNGVIQSPVSNLSGTFSGSANENGNYIGTEDSTFVLRVTQAGALGASARAEVLRDNLVQGGDFALTSGSNITLGDGAQIRLNAGLTTLGGTTSSTSDGYNGPVTISGPYSGEENDEVIVRVRNAGRVDGSARLEYSLDNGSSYTGNIAVTSGGAINLDEGLQVQFTSAPTPTYGSVVNGSGSYSGSVSFGGAYTGESDSTVIVRARESGALSASPTIGSTARSTSDGYAGAVTIGGSYDGSAGDDQAIVRVRTAGRVDGSARLEYSLDGGASFVGDLAATSGAAISLSAGLEVSFAAAQTPTVSAPVIDSGLYAGPALISGSYTGEEDAALVVAFDAGGTIGAGASYRVSFDGGTNFGASTAAVVGDNALGAGLTLNLAAGDVVIGDEIRASIETHALAVGDRFSADLSDGLVSLEASTNGGGSFGPAFSARADQVQNLGDGVQVTLGAGQLTAGDTLSAAIETYALAVGDSFSADFTGDRLEVGDTFTVETLARDLAVGTRYFVEAGVNRLEVGDEFEVTANHSYDNAVPAVVTPTVTLSNGVEVNFGAGGSFAVGDEFQIHTRGYTGDPIPTGLYTDTLYPTTYIVTVTDEGEVDGSARVRYDRADGRGSGTDIPAVSTAPELLSEDVNIHFTAGFLSEGDQFFISAGEKLEYVFGGTITLQSEEEIELSVSDAEVGNQVGRLLYTGDEALSNEAGLVGNLLSGRLGTNQNHTVSTTSLADQLDAERSLIGIDLAIKQVGEQRTLIGAALNRLSYQSSILSQQRAADQRTLQLLRDVDVSAELTNRVRAQLQQEIGVQLLQAAKFKPRLALQLLEGLL